ncbi:hypothetical protein GCM10007320_08640 [Pseudorhodoferax aquiterrae]|uniref:Uncharacterized protein n=1 Tax=Pseudorhodoferax aquiterrae TaxID=747304 RepID=A0ABQ3FXG9_9BURK|nr:hypothetical protein [Pseudorhodoferax aquiterrae]GHC72632.1 hypothetical protein GCM10007320_08640 [Pseudorhodoferax aquiterrae]
MRPWKHFFPDVMPLVPAVAEPMAEHHIRRAAQEFCRRTRAWRETLDAVITRAGVRCYDLELPPMVELVRLESATLGCEPLELDKTKPGTHIYTPDGKELILSRGPGDGLQLVVTCSLKPDNQSPGIEDALFDLYTDEIALGAVARLTSDELKQEKFEAACDRIKIHLWRGQAATQPRAVPNYF